MYQCVIYPMFQFLPTDNKTCIADWFTKCSLSCSRRSSIPVFSTRSLICTFRKVSFTSAIMMVKSMGKAVVRNGQRREPLLHGNLCTLCAVYPDKSRGHRRCPYYWTLLHRLRCKWCRPSDGASRSPERSFLHVKRRFSFVAHQQVCISNASFCRKMHWTCWWEQQTSQNFYLHVYLRNRANSTALNLCSMVETLGQDPFERTLNMR